jgi:EAL domain-containing protein (putative c-di-GMP-specific phosphodiesterase class I)
MSVIAEGVETKEQIDHLRKNGCDEVQDYLLSHPLSAKSFEIILSKSRNFL